MMMDEEHIPILKSNFLAIRRLKHPNIIKFKALYLDMKKHLSYLVMEYVTFPNIRKYLDEHELKDNVTNFFNEGPSVDFRITFWDNFLPTFT